MLGARLLWAALDLLQPHRERLGAPVVSEALGRIARLDNPLDFPSATGDQVGNLALDVSPEVEFPQWLSFLHVLSRPNLLMRRAWELEGGHLPLFLRAMEPSPVDFIRFTHRVLVHYDGQLCDASTWEEHLPRNNRGPIISLDSHPSLLFALMSGDDPDASDRNLEELAEYRRFCQRF